MSSFFYFLLIFSLIVFFHELGHFYIAKRSGILCREFSIGFGPKVFVLKKEETTYTFRLLPFGGYVSMAGESDIFEDGIKKGQTLGIRLNSEGNVKDIILNNISQYQDIYTVIVDNIDLENSLTITSRDEDTEEITTFYCAKNTFIHFDGEKTLIATADRKFNNKPLKNRFMTILAGPLMNFALAVLLFSTTNLIYGVPTNKIKEVRNNTPASLSSLNKGDIILSINGEQMDSWNETQEYIAKRPNEQVIITILRGNVEKDIDITIGSDTKKVGKQIAEVGYIGVEGQLDKSILNSLKHSIQQIKKNINLILNSLREIFLGGLTLDNLSGPVGIYKVTEEVARSGLYNILNFAAFLSLNIGIFNLLPIPALDGGKLLFLTIEFIIGKKVNEKLEGSFQIMGFLLLITLMILVTWNDIIKLY